MARHAALEAEHAISKSKGRSPMESVQAQAAATVEGADGSRRRMLATAEWSGPGVVATGVQVKPGPGRCTSSVCHVPCSCCMLLRTWIPGDVLLFLIKSLDCKGLRRCQRKSVQAGLHPWPPAQD